MNYVLYKLSVPGFKHEYDSYGDVRQELEGYVCGTCKEDYFNYYGTRPKSIYELLGTACGCEFSFENPEEDAKLWPDEGFE